MRNWVPVGALAVALVLMLLIALQRWHVSHEVQAARLEAHVQRLEARVAQLESEMAQVRSGMPRDIGDFPPWHGKEPLAPSKKSPDRASEGPPID
jgi:hypothetical protein